MEINKQLFEDVFSGKLKGTFVLRDKQIVKSNTLKRSSIDNFPYKILINYGNGVTDYGLYKSNGDFESYGTSYFDIINFIPETDMKENELKIQIPENQEIDWQESAKQEKIVFKKKYTKPRSWEEYCEQRKNIPCYVLGYDVYNGYWCKPSIPKDGYCTVPSEELAEAFLAMMQLMSLRQAWIGDWKPDWKNSKQWKANILCDGSGFVVAYFGDLISRPLSFPTREMANDFMNTFKDLLEIAKPLI